MALVFKEGDLVKHTAAFLQSTGWYTDVPVDGIVRSVDAEGWPCVQWCNDEAGKKKTGVRINPANIMRAGAPDYSGM